MIVRIWHGCTTPENADAYQQLLDGAIVPNIIARGISGLRGVDILCRRDRDDGEVEFLTITTSSSLDTRMPAPAPVRGGP